MMPMTRTDLQRRIDTLTIAMNEAQDRGLTHCTSLAVSRHGELVAAARKAFKLGVPKAAHELLVIAEKEVRDLTPMGSQLFADLGWPAEYTAMQTRES